MALQLAHEATIQATPQTISEAISTQRGLAGFWTVASDAQPAVGSIARFGFPGAPGALKMRIDALDPGRRVAWTCLGDFPEWAGTTVSWELTPLPDGAGTTVLFRHGGWADQVSAEAMASVNYTWGQVVARLKGYSETDTPQPYFG
jgi:uncharacterized protein YndB with AHSA1/START domain